MSKNTLMGLVLLVVFPVFLTGAVHAADDQLSSLITRVNTQTKNSDVISPLENKLLGRASWKIKCQYKAFDDMKACVMSKGPISILHMNSQYIVNIGDKHEKNTMAFIRVDQGDSLQDREGLFRNGTNIVGQLKRGNYAYTRFQQNKGQAIENKISLVGFTDAFNDMEAQFAKLADDKNIF